MVLVVENNLLRLTSVEIEGRSGRYFLASASPVSVFDRGFASTLSGAKPRLTINENRALPLSPTTADLRGTGDAFIGVEPWGRHAISIDYRSGLVTYQEAGIHPAYMTLYRFEEEPSITVVVDGKSMPAVIDTASPDTLILPRGKSEAMRKRARVELAGVLFPSIDIYLGDVTRARIGNRLLSKFLVTIDYGRREAGLWRDPRIPLE